ncbi:MAG: dehydrogenase [Rhizobiaceae bacterium]|nr:dehydrogenase [Rhizobiaceae bacterium]
MAETRARIGVTADLFGASGEPMFSRSLFGILDAAKLGWEILPVDAGRMNAAAIADFDALFIGTSKVDEQALQADTGRLRLIARNGVGIDAIDHEALARRGILLTNSPEAVRHGVAVSALGFILALSLRLPVKSRLIAEGRWAERGDHTGIGLQGRVVGIVGFGGIGREIARVVAPLGARLVVSDPFLTPEKLAGENVTLLPLEDLLRQADMVVIACNLDPSTFHLIDAERLALMNRDAFLINVARGPIVDEAALIAALERGEIAGAGLDVFEREPPDPASPLFRMDTVIATPHCLCWTDQFVDGVAETGLRGIVEVMQGRVPKFVVNRTALDHDRVRSWLERDQSKG